ncbi:MAG: hypothetical protein J6C59_11045, partial [Muribaculaceae bacterium]|nr:hypothetical protein [Muribaculaceae bacterium]
EAYGSYLSAKTVYTHAHIGRMLRHDNTVVFVQIKHGTFLSAKLAPRENSRKNGLFGMDTKEMADTSCAGHLGQNLIWGYLLFFVHSFNP